MPSVGMSRKGNLVHAVFGIDTIPTLAADPPPARAPLQTSHVSGCENSTPLSRRPQHDGTAPPCLLVGVHTWSSRQSRNLRRREKAVTNSLSYKEPRWPETLHATWTRIVALYSASSVTK